MGDPVSGDKVLPKERRTVPKRSQQEMGPDVWDTFDAENTSNFPHSDSRRSSHRVKAQRVKFEEEVLRVRPCVLDCLLAAVTYFMFISM